MLKQYLYKQRCFKEKPCFEQFKIQVLKTRSIEFYIAKKNNKLQQHTLKWEKDCKNNPSYVEDNYVLEYIQEM